MELVDSVPAVPAEAPSPTETAAEVTPAVEAPASTEVAPETPAPETVVEPQLFDTPDGRKVDAATLAREWKENFYPEFTRKSQRLAALETPITQEEPAWKNPDFSPSTWAEAIDIAKAEAVKEILEQANQAESEQAQIRTEVENQLTEIKATDPKLDEDSLFQHATEYGFRDLKTAYANQQAMKRIALDTEQRVLKNLGNRAADPISTNSSVPPVTAPKEEFDSVKASNFRSALDFLEAIKKK